MISPQMPNGKTNQMDCMGVRSFCVAKFNIFVHYINRIYRPSAITYVIYRQCLRRLHHHRRLSEITYWWCVCRVYKCRPRQWAHNAWRFSSVVLLTEATIDVDPKCRCGSMLPLTDLIVVVQNNIVLFLLVFTCFWNFHTRKFARNDCECIGNLTRRMWHEETFRWHSLRRWPSLDSDFILSHLNSHMRLLTQRSTGTNSTYDWILYN